MKLVSFDIGIKNMAYCVFEISGNMPFISSWDIINLTDQENIEKNAIVLQRIIRYVIKMQCSIMKIITFVESILKNLI